MAHDDANGRNSQPSPDARVFALLDKIGDFHWTLQIVSLALFLDSALMISKGTNLLHYPWPTVSWSAEVNWLIFAVVAYALIASAMLPFMEGLTGYLVRLAYISFFSEHFEDGSAYKRHRNQVTYLELKEYADRKESAYALAACKAWDELTTRREKDRSTLCRLAFRTLALLLWNLYLSKPRANSTIMDFSSSISSDAFALSALAVVTPLVLSCLASWCRSSYEMGWITYAPLYDEIKKELDEQERQRKEYLEQSMAAMRAPRSRY